jgi:hypothetical protein
MPTRKPSVGDIAARDVTLTKDLDAYKRLRRDGLQPPDTTGSHRLEQRATDLLEIETGRLLGDV